MANVDRATVPPTEQDAQAPEDPATSQSYRDGQRVTVRLAKLKSLSRHLTKEAETMTGRILQRCGPASYDVSLDDPPTSELTLLSWVPEEALEPADQTAAGTTPGR